MTTYKLLFICTGNSARSILAECLLNHLGGERFRAYSAGSRPKGVVHPHALATLDKLHIPHDGVHSKNWYEFSRANAPALDFVITVCDNAAGEVCPVWPGQPTTAHWGLPDPAATEGTPDEQNRAFMDAAITIKRRIELMLALPMHKLDALSLQQHVRDIGAQ